MPDTDVVRTFMETCPPRHLRLAAACRLVPLPPAQTLALLIHLQKDQDPEVAAAAAASLGSQSEEEVLDAVRSRDCPARVFEHFGASGTSTAVLEAIVMNPASPESVVAIIAGHAPPDIVTVILYNRVRLIEHPEIVRALRRNPSISREAERTLLEIEQEFFGGKKQYYRVESEPQAVAPPPEEREEVSGLAAEDLALEGLPVEPGAREKALAERLTNMTVPQKTRMAVLGNREARAILIRDPNKEVARAVLKSPKISEAEVESFASMRNVSEEILRDIGMSKEWTRSYGVIHSLVRNPKTPPMISQRMMFRLMTKDLSGLVKDKGVPEVVRRTAQQVLSHRSPGKSG